MNSVSFVGPLPPPLHGFSLINQKMIDKLEKNGVKVAKFNVAPSKPWTPFLQLLKFIVASIRSSPNGRSTLYLPLSGGLRQILDLAFFLVASSLNSRVFVHHHSFSYLNKPTWYSRLLLTRLKSAVHIVLCSEMGRLLSGTYGIPCSNLRIVSNAAFLDHTISASPAKADAGTPLRLGFLSNITTEKGIFVFFETLRYLKSLNISVVASIAGPVQEDIERQFVIELANHSEATYCGPVYGAAKKDFFSRLDLLLFPTLYLNEAEPVTLWESLASGVPVIAVARGCIGCIALEETGLLVDDPKQFSAHVAEFIKVCSQESSVLTSLFKTSRETFERKAHESQKALISVVAEMQG
jgi:glycosyltransferase involved in cell wall biosynthesis